MSRIAPGYLPDFVIRMSTWLLRQPLLLGAVVIGAPLVWFLTKVQADLGAYPLGILMILALGALAHVAATRALRLGLERDDMVRALLNAPPEAALLIDTEGTILALNEMAARKYSAKRPRNGEGELLGMCVFDLLPPDVAASRRLRNEQVIETGESSRFEDESGGRWFENSIYPVHDVRSGGVRQLAIFSGDITRRKRAERDLESRAKELADINGHLTKTTACLAESQRELTRVNRELQGERDAVAQLNASLEERVRKRTKELRLTNEELQQRNSQLQEARAQAKSDALTGLGNHRAFHERIKEQISSAQASGAALGLIMLDIDNFKQVNDLLGHLAGDQALRELAATLAALHSPEDIFRYGGDEFAILVPGANREMLTGIAERMRLKVEKRAFAGEHRMTISLGCAFLSKIVGPSENLIYRADMAMYWAKAIGKNQIGDWESLPTNHRSDGLDDARPWYLTDSGVRAPDVITTLLAALAVKDPLTAAHGERCSQYAYDVAREMGLQNDEISIVRQAALLHDVGKLTVSETILSKPGPLNDDEWERMRRHSQAGVDILANVRSLTNVAPGVLHHHEHYDGSGYPDGLKGEEIPIASRILLVTDAFDAMTTDRPYRKAMSVEAAIAELKRARGTQFDPRVVAAFVKTLAPAGGKTKPATDSVPVA